MARKSKYTTFEQVRAAHVADVSGLAGLISTRIEFLQLTAKQAVIRTAYRGTTKAVMAICMQSAPTSLFVDVMALPGVRDGVQTTFVVVDEEIVDLNDLTCRFDMHINFKRTCQRKASMQRFVTLEMSPAETEARIRANQRA